MNKTYSILIVVGILLLDACNPKKHGTKDNDTTTTKESSYFGQTPPGLTAEIFAPGVVSVNGRYEYAVSFSSEFDEMYFSGNKEEDSQSVYFSRLKDHKWTSPKKANFTNGLHSVAQQAVYGLFRMSLGLL